MKKIILVNLLVSGHSREEILQKRGYNPSLGLLYLGTHLELNGYKVNVIDLNYLEFNNFSFLDIIRNSEPLFIGISTYTENIDSAFKLSKSIKRLQTDIPIVLGGPHASFLPENSILSKYIDFIIIKEGEATMLELAESIYTKEKAIKFDDIDGLVFKRNNRIIKNKLRNSITNLDLLPIVKREIVDIEKYNSGVNIISGRGCPGNCIYCSATAFSGAKYRARNIFNVFLEIVQLKILLKEKISHISIVDDTFTSMPDRVFNFISLRRMYNLNVDWDCESRIDSMNKELIYQMSIGGCKGIQYGIESGDQHILNKIEKGLNLEYAKKIIEYTYRYGIKTYLGFIVGHYCDTKYTMKKTLSFLLEMHSKFNCSVSLSYNTPFPGTFQYTHSKKLGIQIAVKDYSKFTLSQPVIETKEFTLLDQINIYLKVLAYAQD